MRVGDGGRGTAGQTCANGMHVCAGFESTRQALFVELDEQRHPHDLAQDPQPAGV
jgi:hypothetical protein